MQGRDRGPPALADVENDMTYSTLMVHLELGHANAALLRIAGDLAQNMNAAVIGIAACRPMTIGYGNGYVSADVIEMDRAELVKEIAETEAEFRRALGARVKTLEWRSLVTFEPLPDFLACEARNADLVVTGLDRGRPVLDTSRRVNTGDLVMQAGRPVLLVPAGVNRLELDLVMIGWKDTREARRAAYDALPLLSPHTIGAPWLHALSHARMMQRNMEEGANFYCDSEPVRQDVLALCKATAVTVLEFVEDGQGKDGGLAAAGLGAGDQVTPGQGFRQGQRLDFGRGRMAGGVQVLLDGVAQAEFGECLQVFLPFLPPGSWRDAARLF